MEVFERRGYINPFGSSLRMDPLFEALRSFARDGAPRASGTPLFSRSRDEHALIIRRSVSLTAIDAGLALIARRSNGAIGVVRVVAVSYDHPGLSVSSRQWVVVVQAQEDSYEVRMTCLESGEVREASLAAVHAGVRRDPESGLDLARAMLERELQSSTQGLVFADGSLAPQLPEEREACSVLGPNVLGLVKRSSVAKTHAPEALVSHFAEPVFAHELAGAFYCRLHPLSEHIIRVEGSLDEDRFESLLVASSDAAFPGYPYALVLADRFARVSVREAKSLALESAARFGVDVGSVHGILDSLER